MTNNKRERIHLLADQVSRLQKRIALLDQQSNRYSWTRVAIFFSGVVLTILAYAFVNWWLSLVVALVTLLTFGAVAYFHGKIDRSLARHMLWQHIKETHVARMKLDWDAIPPSNIAAPPTGHPFAVDLDIIGTCSIHQLVNTAISQEGRERLSAWLLSTTPDLPTILKRQALVRELIPMTIFRDKLTLHALLTSRKAVEQLESKRLLQWLAQQPLPGSFLPLLWATAALNVLTVILFLLSTFFLMPQLWIFSLLLSVILLFTLTNKKRKDLFEDAMYLRDGLAALSVVFEYLENYPYGPHTHLKELCAPFQLEHGQRPSTLLKHTSRIASATALEKNGLLWLIINALMPWDLYCAYHLSQYKRRIARHLSTWLDTWFELEAVSSLATFAYLNPEYTLPAVIANDEQSNPMCFQATGLGHPLIPVEKKVVNDFTMHEPGEVILITGSNMSGKSTFLRTLGVNLCLAYAGGPVNARELQTSLFRLFTCIRVSDSVTDGYSYFYAEVKRLKALLVALEQRDSYPLFFLIDEIFKGTNNRERLSGSRSFVRSVVGQNCVGAISTHDLELVTLAEMLTKVENYHFREDVVDGRMVFDYTLRPGPCPTTNALKIMRMEGLPVDEVLPAS